MRRDLTRGCAACRLRFSALLTHCPVCHTTALSVTDATSRIQPTSRAAWLAKWLIVLSSLPAIGVILWAGTGLISEGLWPPRNSLDILVYLLGSMGTCLGMTMVVAIPFAIWFCIVSAVRFILQFLVDRPRRMLRVTIERGPRPSSAHSGHPVHRLLDKLSSFVQQLKDAPQVPILIGTLVFIGAQILAETFGRLPTIKTTSFKEFGESLIMLVIINVMAALMLGFFVGVFSSFGTKVKDFLAKPPNLFGYNSTPPSVQNEACLESFVQSRQEIVGHAAALDAAEQAAIEASAITELRAPLSGQTCLAFRLQGDADGQLVDDADAMNFAVVTEQGQRCVVTNSDCVVALPAETKIRAQNAHGFFQKRGLPERDLSVREGLLREGDLVRVVGRRTEIRIGTAGYRGDERRMMIDAGDGLPVVIQAANAPPS